MAESFKAQLDRIGTGIVKDLMAVVKQSGQDVFRDAQLERTRGGRMRVDTGWLRNSLESFINGASQSMGSESYVLSLAGMEPGDVMAGYWTAEYAIHREFGTKYSSADWYMRGAAQKWQQFVEANAERLLR